MNEMEYRCPKCHRFGMNVDFRYWVDKLYCLWGNCGYHCTFSEEENAKHPFKFKKFRDSLKPKIKMC